MVISKIYNIFGENKLLKTSCLYFKLTTGIIRYYILIPLLKQWIFAHWDYLYHSFVSAILTRMKIHLSHTNTKTLVKENWVQNHPNFKWWFFLRIQWYTINFLKKISINSGNIFNTIEVNIYIYIYIHTHTYIHI